jgi:hypothetical protein
MPSARHPLTLALIAAALSIPAARAEALLLLDVAGQGSSAVVAPDETFTVQVLAQDLPAGSDGNGLFGFGFEIGFAPGAFAAGTPSIEPVWTGQQATSVSAASVGATANRSGETCGPFGTNCALGSGSVLLASVELTALADGPFTLSLGHFTAAGDNVLFDLTVLDLEASFFQGATVEVVPEPSVAILLGAPLLLVALRRRR